MTTPKRRIPINNHRPAAEQNHRPAPAHADREDAGRPDAREPAEEAPATQVPEAGHGDQAGALEEIAQERDALADSLVRLRAEFDNYRKRAARELIEARERSQGELIRELLPVLDNLERAIDAAEHHDEGKVLRGVRMTRDMFVALLRSVGVEEIETLGTHFNPQLHDAVIMQASEEVEGSVTAVLERGYRQGERVLRPARVAVSSGLGSADGGAGHCTDAGR